MSTRQARSRAGAASLRRPAQRRRTRKAIVDAAIALIHAGKTPSVAEVARAAEVSRRTMYLYFPSFDQLLLDATVGALAQQSVDQAISGAPNGVEERVVRLVRALTDVSPEIERLGRELVRLTLTIARPVDLNAPTRGYRRIEWIESTVAAWREPLGEQRWRRLIAALAMIVGWEALIVQRDICGLTPDRAVEVSEWAARALVAAARRELKAGRGARRRGRRP
jgi:AcrR family transcriptional regulator